MMKMKWSPWAAGDSEVKRRKYRVKMEVKRIEGLVSAAGGGGGSTRTVWVEIRWRREPRIRAFSALRGRMKPARSVSEKAIVKGGMAEWRDGDGASFNRVCGFSVAEEETRDEWEISFHLYAKGAQKLQVLGTAKLNLRHLISEVDNDQRETLRKLPVVSPAGSSDAKISVGISSVEIVSVRDAPEQTTSRNERTGESSSSTSESEAASEQSGGGKQLSRRGFLSWRKKRKTGDKVQETNIEQVSKWEKKELISRDGKTKLRASTFFATIDQRDESAGGESACTALVVVIADKLLSAKMNPPSQPQFDALIREGSSEWRKLCDSELYAGRFPDKHFDLETILQANLRPVFVSPESSFVGFISPESFESLRGGMSFDDIWNEVSDAGEEGDAARLFIVSWNDHFFLLKLEAEACYVIDTLGERLFEGCDKAYILKFDESSSIARVPEEGEPEDIVCKGKDCCREFINRFLVSIPLREELEAEEKRRDRQFDSVTVSTLHQRLQIELHRVKRNA